MPTYVYKCDDCGQQFELFQKMSDDPVDICPACGSKVRRVFHPVGVVFKGSGWYINDSRAKNGASDSSTGDKAESKKSDDTKATDTAKAEPAKTAAD